MNSRRLSALLALFLATPALSFAALPNVPERCSCGKTARKAVCPKDVPAAVSYKPRSPLCKNKAAVVLKGPFVNSFSVVVRDSQNRDRWPVSGYGGCSFGLANSGNPPGRCSAFKASREYITKVNGANARVVCFPEAGTSGLWKDVRRITIKGANTSSSIRRYCLQSASKALN